MVKFEAQVLTDDPEGSSRNLKYKRLGWFDSRGDAVQRVLNYAQGVTYFTYRLTTGSGKDRVQHVEGDPFDLLDWLKSNYAEEAERIVTPWERVKKAVEDKRVEISEKGVKGKWFREDVRSKDPFNRPWHKLDGLGSHTVVFDLPYEGNYVIHGQHVTMTDQVPEAARNDESIDVADFHVPPEWIGGSRPVVDMLLGGYFYHTADGVQLWED